VLQPAAAEDAATVLGSARPVLVRRTRLADLPGGPLVDRRAPRHDPALFPAHLAPGATARERRSADVGRRPGRERKVDAPGSRLARWARPALGVRRTTARLRADRRTGRLR